MSLKKHKTPKRTCNESMAIQFQTICDNPDSNFKSRRAESGPSILNFLSGFYCRNLRPGWQYFRLFEDMYDKFCTQVSVFADKSQVYSIKKTVNGELRGHCSPTCHVGRAARDSVRLGSPSSGSGGWSPGRAGWASSECQWQLASLMLPPKHFEINLDWEHFRLAARQL
jgi:hypothetical protein